MVDVQEHDSGKRWNKFLVFWSFMCGNVVHLHFCFVDRYRYSYGDEADKEEQPLVVGYYDGAPIWGMNFGMKYKLEGAVNYFLFFYFSPCVIFFIFSQMNVSPFKR